MLIAACFKLFGMTPIIIERIRGGDRRTLFFGNWKLEHAGLNHHRSLEFHGLPHEDSSSPGPERTPQLLGNNHSALRGNACKASRSRIKPIMDSAEGGDCIFLPTQVSDSCVAVTATGTRRD